MASHDFKVGERVFYAGCVYRSVKGEYGEYGEGTVVDVSITAIGVDWDMGKSLGYSSLSDPHEDFLYDNPKAISIENVISLTFSRTYIRKY